MRGNLVALVALIVSAALVSGCSRHDLSAAEIDAMQDHLTDLSTTLTTAQKMAEKARYRSNPNYASNVARDQKVLTRSNYNCVMKARTSADALKCD